MTCRTALRAVGFCLLAGASIGRPTTAVAMDDAEVLQPGVTAEFELEVGAVRRHAVTLEAGQLLHVDVREKGSRIILTLLDEKGSTLARRQAVFFEMPTLRLFAIAPVTGAYALEVRSSGEGWPGTYEIRMDEPRPATEDERALPAADDALAAAGDVRGQALVMLNRGSIVLDVPTIQPQEEGAVALFRALGDRDGEAAALDQLAVARLTEGDVEAARGLFEANVEYARTVDNRRLLAQSLTLLGATSLHVGQAERAVEFSRQALAAGTAAGSPMLQGASWGYLSSSYRRLGDPGKAVESSLQALSIARATGNSLMVAYALTNVG